MPANFLFSISVSHSQQSVVSHACQLCYTIETISVLKHPGISTPSHPPATKHYSIPELSQQHSQSTGPRCGGYKQHWNSSSSGAHPGHPVERSRATRELSCQLDSCQHSLQLHHHPGGKLQHSYNSRFPHRILTLCN